MLIQRGYRGINFGDIAERLQTTRANIHHHFGNKVGLVEEVMEDYAKQLLMRYQAIWTDSRTTLEDKIRNAIAFNRERYDAHNIGADAGLPWSLLDRLRSDSDVLNQEMLTTLRDVMREIELYVSIGIGTAIRNGELRPDTPHRDIALQIFSIISYAPSITRHTGTFQRLEDLYRSTMVTIERAYGLTKPEQRSHRPARRARVSRA